MKKLLPAVLAAAGFTLAACGGTTVDSDDVTATQSAPSTTATEATTETQTETSAPEKSDEADPALDNEGAASEVEAPADEPMRPAEEEAYLEALREGGVNVDGNEEQLVSTARTICDGSMITRDAVAGQLVEQEQTKLDADKVAELIDASANDHICS